MKNIILATLLILFSNAVFSQSLIIYKTDHTALNFSLSEVDSITFSVVSVSQALDPSNWECMLTEPTVEKVQPAAGVFEKDAEGLKIFGTANQINKAVHPASIADHPIMDKSIYLKWKAVGNGSFMQVTLDLFADTTNWSAANQTINLTTNHSANGSTIITDDTWYYTRLVVTATSVNSVTSTDNYDDHGGTIVQELSIHPSEAVQSFTFGTKADEDVYVLLGEARIE